MPYRPVIRARLPLTAALQPPRWPRGASIAAGGARPAPIIDDEGRLAACRSLGGPRLALRQGLDPSYKHARDGVVASQS
eukprot:scaffold115_cov304-Prasinococcus_capsulatus_cf.AAC.45